MKRGRFLPLLPLIALALASAPPVRAALDATWHVQSGASLEAVASGPEGSIVAVGARTVGAHGSEAVVKTFTRTGDLLWTRAWPPGAHPNAAASAVSVTPTGRIYVAGTRHTYRVTGAWFVLAYGPGGRLLHVHRGPSIPDSFVDIAGIETRGDRVVVAGTNVGCCEAFTYQGWVETFRPDLTRLWSTDLGRQHPASDLALGPAGQAYVAGWRVARWEPVPVPIPAMVTLTLTKLDLEGDVPWTRDTGITISDSEPSGSVSARGGRVMLTAPHNGRGWLARFAPDGDLVWARTYGAHMPTWQQVSIVVDRAKGTWVAGTRRDPVDQRADAFVRRFRPDGTVSDTLVIEDTIPSDATVHGSGVAVVGRSTPEERGVLWQIAA